MDIWPKDKDKNKEQNKDNDNDKAQVNRAPILVGGGSVINEAYRVLFLPLGRDGVTIASLYSIHLVRTRPAVSKKTPP